MDRLSIVLTLMTGAVMTGALTVAAFSFDFYGWPAIIAAAGIGFAASWPVAYVISRRVKRNDPAWSDERRTNTGAIPKPGAPEV